MPIVRYGNGQNAAKVCVIAVMLIILYRISLAFMQEIQNAGMECKKQKKKLPTLVFVVLPPNGNDIYREVKQWVSTIFVLPFFGLT